MRVFEVISKKKKTRLFLIEFTGKQKMNHFPIFVQKFIEKVELIYMNRVISGSEELAA